MSGCPNEPSAAATPSAVDLLANDDKPSLLATSYPPSLHPNRLIEFEDEDILVRFVMQLSVAENSRMNPLQFDQSECYRQPDAYVMKLLTPQIVSEVEKALIELLSEESYLFIINSDSTEFISAVTLKKSKMEQSALDTAMIEAALTDIMEHLDQHPNLIKVLGEAKIGYHDKGAMFNDMGVRNFVIKGQEKANNAN